MFSARKDIPAKEMDKVKNLDACISQLSYYAGETIKHGKGVSQRIENGTFDQRHVERAVERIGRRVFGKNMEVK